jgi:hypothetical protein
MHRLARLIAIVSVVSFLSAPPVLAVQHKYIEHFATTQYKDAANTTAWWNAAGGELKLFPFALTLAGTYATPTYALGVAVSGDYAYIAAYSNGLLVLDISDPAHPALVGSRALPSVAQAVEVSGNYAYVACFLSGLQIVDISNPASPTLVGAYDTPNNALDVAVSGRYAFVADWGGGLHVIDIGNPASPTLVGSYDTPGSAYGVDVVGNKAYVADGDYGLHVIDISNPASPTLVGTCDTPGSAGAVTVSGDYAFVGDGYSGMQAIDIRNPAAPAIAGTCNTPGYTKIVDISGDYAYVADYYSGFQVIDITDPAHPTLAGGYDTPDYSNGVALAGKHAFVADRASGLQVIEIRDPIAPAFVGSYDTPGSADGIAVSGTRAYVADEMSGLRVISVSDPANPALVGSYDPPADVFDVAVVGRYAFLACGASGLDVVDISDPEHPSHAGSCDTPGSAVDVVVSGTLAFVADYTAGLQIIDVSNPASPAFVGAYDTPGNALAVTVAGSRAYVADDASGLQIINVGNPASPTLLGAYDTPGNAKDVAVTVNRAFVADNANGLVVINISNPASPTLVGTCDTPGYAQGVAISGDYAFVADWASGLQAINISNPASPTLLGSYDTPGSAGALAVSGGRAFVADFASGLCVLQVFQSEVYSGGNIGLSLAVDASSDAVFKARVVTTQTSTVTWEVSANGGASWQGIVPNGSWNKLTVPGTDLLWRSTHSWAQRGVNPRVTQLEIDWLYEAAAFDSIVDVPNDQGGSIRVHFARSGRDFSDETALPITSYGIWRRVDSAVLLTALETQASPAIQKRGAGETPELGGIPVVAYQGRTFVQSRLGPTASSFPPGVWEWVGTVPAVQKDAYIAAVPTVADSSGSGAHHTVLALTAHTTTPSIWYMSEPDSGYSVDNIAPQVPTGFAVAYNTGGGNRLSWDPSPAEDFQYFRIYRSNDPDFVPSSASLVHSTTGTIWSDPDYDGWSVYYKITALDYVENESDPASAGTVTEAEGPVIPQTYGLYPNVPNPFNPSTSIRFDVPAGGGVVILRIYDVSGKLIRTLVDGPQTAGQKNFTWNGRDNLGRNAVSGVYFCRMEAPAYRKTMKMILVK